MKPTFIRTLGFGCSCVLLFSGALLMSAVFWSVHRYVIMRVADITSAGWR